MACVWRKRVVIEGAVRVGPGELYFCNPRNSTEMTCYTNPDNVEW